MNRSEFLKFTAKIEEIERQLEILDPKNSIEATDIDLLRCQLEIIQQELLQNKRIESKARLTLVQEN